MPPRTLNPTDRLVRRSSGDQAATYIRRLIFEGELRPGERVPQEEIARALGCSRIPVREALIALEREGWVVIELHRGAFISALDEPSVRDHYDLFGQLYGFAVQRAVERDPDELLRRLRELGDVLATTDDVAEFQAATIQFHDAVVDSAHSPRVRAVLRGLTSIIPGNFFELVPGAIEVERRAPARRSCRG